MAKKRFTDIEIWDKEWYMDLSPKHKCLMKYIFDKCDASGCWKPNWKLATLHIGEPLNFADLAHLPKDQYEILENGKIFITDFVKFQYGTLSRKSPAHNPIFTCIEKNGLSNRVLCRVVDNLIEEDIEKEIEGEVDMDGEKEKEKSPKKNFNTKPLATDFNGLPDLKVNAVIQLIKITKQTDISKDDVTGLWEVFKVQNLTGKKFYQDNEGVYSHFINWSKTQKIEHGKQSSNGQQSGFRDSVKDEFNKRVSGRG